MLNSVPSVVTKPPCREEIVVGVAVESLPVTRAATLVVASAKDRSPAALEILMLDSDLGWE